MSFPSRRFYAQAVLSVVFSAFIQTTHASTIDMELLVPQPSEGTAYLLPISEALNGGDLARAESLVRTRLGLAHNDAIAWEVLGVTLALGGNASEADAAYAKAVELDPKRLSAWVKRGDLAEASGNMPDALIYWTSALEIAPAYIPAHQRLGIAYANANDLPGAIKHLEAAVSTEKTAEPDIKIELAFVYNRAGRPNDAIALFADNDTATDAAVDPRLMLALGNAHAQLGDIDKALSHYQRGLDLAPDDLALLKAKGALLVETGDAAGAAETLTKPAAAEPVDAFSNLQYARALLALGRLPEAVSSAERALNASESPDISRQALTVTARAQLMSRDFPAATETTTRLVALFPDDPASWREHAAIYGATGQYTLAKEIYDKAISRFDGDAELLKGRSIVNVRLGQLESAAEDAALAAKSAPAWLEPRFLLGEIERARGQNEKAEEAFGAALALDPDHWPSLMNLAALRLAAGDTAQALLLAQRAVKISGGAQSATDILEKAKAQQ